MDKMSRCKEYSVDKILSKYFYKLGFVVAKHPGYFLIVPMFITAICITGYQRIHFEMDPEYLFSPEKGPGKTERSLLEHFFPVDYTSRFNPTRITRPGRYARVLVTPKHGQNMLTVDIWKELRLLDGIIKNTTIIFGEEHQSHRYEDICAKWIDRCFENDILNLDHIIGEVENKKFNLTFPVMFNPVTWDVHTFPAFFGGTIFDQDDVIVSVPCVQLFYFIAADNQIQDARGSVWEEAFLESVGNSEENGVFQYISTARFASRTLDIELEKNTRSVIPYFSSTFIIMVTFSVITSMMTDWVRSKPILGLLGNISAVMGTAAAFGLAIYCGIDFIGINFVSPFLMCSIGIDDTFVMLAAWRRTPVTMDVPERMANTLSDSAVSITITSLTDIVSFWIGQNSPFPAIQIFCIYSGLAVLFIFVWHITFFAACVAIFGYMEQRNLHSIMCVPVLPVSMSHEKSWLYRMFCSGGINPKEPDHPEDNPENAVMVWCRDSLGWALNQWIIKFLVILVFIVYLIGAFYGTTKIQEGLQRRKLSKPDSYSIEFYDREDFYFREFSYRIQVVIAEDLNYWDPDVQEQIENLTRTFESSPYISSPLYTESWLRSFLGYVDRNKEYFNTTIDTPGSFIKTLKELWLFKPNPFSLDIKFNEDETRIRASRFIIQAVNISDGNVEKDMVRDLRLIAQQSKFNVTVFHPYFVFFDQFELVKPISIQSMVVGGLIMMIISFVFIPNFICSLWVALSIISIEVGVVGYMALWGVNLDSISMVNLIMCIGFSVDFTAHICYAYMSSNAESSSERVRESLYSLGLPIFQGAMSTILGVTALLLAGSYIFLVFFKMIFLVIIFGALHGMFLLPVLLSLCGTRKRCNRRKQLPEAKVFAQGHGHGHPPYCIPHPSLHSTIQHLKPKHYGIPLHGMVHGQGPSIIVTSYDGDKHSRFIVDAPEKDLGLGTSEDSSESNSSKSQKQKQKKENEQRQRQRYIEGWCKPSALQINQKTAHCNIGYANDEERWAANFHQSDRYNINRSPHPHSQHYPSKFVHTKSYEPRYH